MHLEIIVLVLLLALACSPATVPSAAAADRADDFILEIDTEAGGAVKRRLSFAQHVDIPSATWPGMRAAAANTLPALDAWFSTYQNGAWNAWWTSFTPAQREHARQAILKGT